VWDSACVSAPTGVVTFLFTDIEGSTRRWESDADAMRTALSAHDTVLRSVIDAHGGYLFKHTGDGVVAAFASPKAAVDAAVAAQRELELPVRMGIATGEASLVDGDYFGAVLNRAARIMAAGHGGQILVADSTAGLLNGVELRDLGPRRLRDVPNPVGLCQVRASGLREEFPPLRALDPSPGNLRRATTSLLGRDAETADIIRSVNAHRLVTLTGVGGVGKTRLAVEVGTQLGDEFPDGVWLFELAAVTDPAAVPDAVASVLGVTQQPGMTLAESVATALDGRVRLLVLDNCEHVLDAAADLIEIVLARSATVRILATSREGIGLADEQVWRVRSLDVDTATDLFVERAGNVAQGFSAEDPAVVSEICRRLDGIPLAVELAASRMSSMTAVEVRDRLDHRFRLLVGSRRGLERHQTLRHAVQWSYDLLDDAEKRLLERCSVFAGGFDLESACAITNSDDEFATLDLLGALVRKSLVTADRSSGQTRYAMLETIRQFAEEQLAERGEADAVRNAHAQFFASRDSVIMAMWDGPRQPAAYNWFKTEIADLRSAFRWAADQDDLDTASVIACIGGWLGSLVENYEPITWAEELVAPARGVGHSRLASLCGCASLCFLFGQVDDALEYSQIGQLALTDGSKQAQFGLELFWLGAVYSALPVNDRYVAFFQERRDHGDDRYGLADAFFAIALTVSGRIEEAMTIASDLPDLAGSDNPFVASYALMCFGMAFSASDPHRALEALTRGLAITQESGNRTNESYIAMTLALTLNRMDGDRNAHLSFLDYIASAVGNYHDSGNVTQVRSALGLFAGFLWKRGDREQAATVTGFAGVMPTAAPSVPEFGATVSDLRDVLGERAYEVLAREGAEMTMATAVAFAYEQIDRVRRELGQLA
jgi:predicted ATPase/class 3 adenylate cyclase